MKISIITISFNSSKTIRNTIESVLHQAYRPLQYVIVDGLSTDDTVDIIKEYKQQFDDAGIELSYKSEKDNGISDGFNKGIERSDGDIIGIINSDDILCEEALDVLSKEMNEETDVCFGNCIIFNDFSGKFYEAVPKNNLNLLKRKMSMFHPACFISRNVYEKYGLFNLNLHYCMDRELLLRFYINGCKFQYINKALACYREGGINQKNYKDTFRESMMVSVEYGMNPLVAELIYFGEIIKRILWKTIQILGLEKIFHKELKN